MTGFREAQLKLSWNFPEFFPMVENQVSIFVEILVFWFSLTLTEEITNTVDQTLYVIFVYQQTKEKSI
jgi:hypothetical protein